MQIVFICDLQLVCRTLTHKITSVTCCIDQDIVRFFLKTALDHCFQIFIFNLKFLKGKIIHINNKTIVTVFDLGDHFIEILELMLVGLNDAKTLIIILVQDTLDTGRFTGSRITKEQTVVCLSSLHKGLCVFDEFFLGDLVAYQVIDLHMCDPCDRLDFYFAIFIMADTECFVKTQLTYTKILVKRYHIIHELFCCGSCCQCFAHLADTVTDSGIKELTVLIRCLIITDHFTAYRSKHSVKYCDIKIIQFLEYLKIILCQVIDAAFDSPTDLACHAEGILVIYQKKCKICMPDISGKSIHSRQFHQPVDAFEKLVFFCLQSFFIRFIKIDKLCHIVQYLTVRKSTVKDTFLNSCQHNK